MTLRALLPQSLKQALRRVLPGGVSSWDRLHPFDRMEGTETGGFITPRPDGLHGIAEDERVGYGGSQPSIVRAALSLLPTQDGYTFMDLGCGKGRPLAVASEYPFARIVGVELDAGFADCARRNARIMARRHPGRTQIEIRRGDATVAEPAGDHVVYFLYHPFHAALMARFVAHLDGMLAGPLRRCVVIYYNPVWHEALDAAPMLCRYGVAEIPYDAAELGFGPDRQDVVAIWQSRSGAWPARPHADRRILRDGPWQARLEPDALIGAAAGGAG